jgi:ParB-like chromosome segregation protein Spo0J
MDLKRIPLDQIIPNPKQPRPPEEFDEQSLNELADTIEAEGLKQPITVRPIDDGQGTLMIVFGERRWRAHRILREKGKLPCGTILANIRRRPPLRSSGRSPRWRPGSSGCWPR